MSSSNYLRLRIVEIKPWTINNQSNQQGQMLYRLYTSHSLETARSPNKMSKSSSKGTSIKKAKVASIRSTDKSSLRTQPWSSCTRSQRALREKMQGKEKRKESTNRRRSERMHPSHMLRGSHCIEETKQKYLPPRHHSLPHGRIQSTYRALARGQQAKESLTLPPNFHHLV